MLKKIKLITYIAMLLFVVSCIRTGWPEKYGVDRDQLLNPNSTPVLFEALNDDDPDVRINVIRHLSKIGTPDVMEKLKTVAETDPDDDVRNYVRRVLRDKAYRDEINKTYDPIRLTIGNSDIEIQIQPEFIFFSGYRDERIVRKIGILPIKIKLLNISNTDFAIDPSLCTLITPKSDKLTPVPPEEVVNKLKFGAKRPAIMTFVFAPAGLVGFIKRKNVNEKTSVHINEEKTDTGYISKSESIDGYLYFNVPKDLSSLEKWNIEIGIKNLNGRIDIIKYDFSETISTRKFKDSQKPTKSITIEQKDSLAEKLLKLKELLDKGLITNDDYEKKKSELLKNF